MPRRNLLLAAAIAVLASGCEPGTQSQIMSSPPLKPLRLATPDPSFRLSPEDRARVRSNFDADALERLMGMIHPDLRRQILRNFLLLEPHELEPGERQGWVTELYDPFTGQVDPVLQAVLEDVYAPLWDEVSDEALNTSHSYFYPGRERAKQRRAARQKEQAGNENRRL